MIKNSYKSKNKSFFNIGLIKKNRKGQAIVETAIILPIMLTMLMGIIDFGLLFNHYLIISNASREASRIAAVGASDLEIATSISNMTDTLNPSNITTTIYPSESYRVKGQEVTITIGYDNELITPIISSVLPNPMHIEAKTVMRVE